MFKARHFGNIPMNQRLCDKFQVYEDVSIQYPTSNEPITNQEKHSFDGILVSEQLIEAKVEVAQTTSTE